MRPSGCQIAPAPAPPCPFWILTRLLRTRSVSSSTSPSSAEAIAAMGRLRPFSHGDLALLHLPGAHHFHAHARAHPLTREEPEEVGHAPRGGVIEGDDDVPQHEARMMSRAVILDGGEQEPAVLPGLLREARRKPDRLHPHAEVAAPDAPMRRQIAHHTPDRRRRDGNPGLSAARRTIHAVDFSGCPNQGSPGEPRRHQRVGSQEEVDLTSQGRPPALAAGAQDAERRLYGSSRAPKSKDDIAYTQFTGVAPLSYGESLRLSLEKRKVRPRIAANERRLGLPPFRPPDQDLPLSLDDVARPADQAVRRPDDAPHRPPPAR